uniref:Ig-like domain-containing protein n=1 Tax=Meloidogyne floridensis TaxID=298350 RepID=A0A915PEM4_9BILA
LSIHEGGRAKWTCKVVSASKPELVDIQWSKIGMEELPSKASQIGHQLVIDQVQYGDVGQYRCTGRLKGDISTDEASLNIAAAAHIPPPPIHVPPAPAQISLPKPIVTPPYQLVDEGQQAVFTCLTPGYADCEVEWHYQRLGGPLPYGWQRRGNQIIVQNAQDIHAGDYICSVTHQLGTTASDPGRLEIRKPTMRVMVEPPEQTVELGNPARFRCWVPEVPDAVLTWRPAHGGGLPRGSEQRDGYLNFPRTEHDHQGQYICAAYDPSRDPQGITPIDSTPVVLNIRTKKPFQPLVEPPYQIVDEGQPIPRPYRCWVPGFPDAVLSWKSAQQQGLPSGVEQIHNGAQLNVPRAEMRHAGDYICVAYDPNDDPHGERPVDSTPVRLEVRQRRPEEPQPPLVDPPRITANIGQPARFRCWVPGNPNAQLTWSPLRGGPLPNGAVDRGGHLIFQSVAAEHEGQYICSYYHPESGRTLKSPPVELDVQEREFEKLLLTFLAKKPLIDPPEQHVPEGKPSRIRCWVPGDSQAQLRFTKPGGLPLPSGSRDDGRGNLHIPQTYKEHEGDYECIAHFPHVPGAPPQTSDLARIYVNPPSVVDVQKPPGKPPAPVATPPQQTVPRGEPARFHCEPNSDTPAQIFWGFGSANGALPTDVSVDDQDILIHAADESTIGDYVCSATNEFGRGVAAPVHLSITDQEEPPTARVEPKVWNGKTGDNHQFKCYVTGNPYPTISWTGPGVEEGQLPEGVADLGDGVLEIKNASKELHDGMYTCTATNPLGEASDDGKANISPPDSTPKITIPPGKPAPARLKLIAGEPLEVKCEARGEPEPDVEWLHDPGPERGDLPDDFVPITISEQFLRHPSIGLGNSGCYTCRASHQNAFITKGICIEATVGILGGQHQWFPLGHPVELVCAASVSSLVEKVEWSKAGGGDHAEADKGGVLRFDAFKAEDEGEYECSAYRKNEVIASSRVELHPEGDTKPELLQVDISPPNIRVVNQGDSIVLDCIVHGHSGEEFNYAWSLARGGSLIRDLGKQSQLQIKSADPSNDYGIYRCEVESEDGEALGQAQTAVAVGFESDGNAVESKFDEDSEAIFTCPVFVVPGATVQWSRESGDSLPSGAHQEADKLVIDKFEDSMAGIYRCTVQYGQNTVNGYLNAKIFVPETILKVILNVSDESVTIGSRAWLDCSVAGDPNAKIEFLKDDSDDLPENAQATLLNVENDEETEAEKRRRKHLHRPKITKRPPEQPKGVEYTLAENNNEEEKQHNLHTEVVELGRPAPTYPSKRRRLRRLRHQRRRALVKKGDVGVVILNASKDKKNLQKQKVRGANLRRRAERAERSHNNHAKHYHNYEIRHDLPPVSGRHSTFGSWFWS